MGRYSYTAQGSRGQITSGTVQAEDEESAVESLRDRGLLVLAISPEKACGLFNIKKSGGKVSGRDLAFFGEQLSTLLAGGLPLVRALSLLSEHSENKQLCQVLSSLAGDVSAGRALHEALRKHPAVFDEIWVSLVQAGEISGQLQAVLRQITAYNESRENIRSKIITAVSYPAVLMTISLGVVVYFVTYIVPVFAEVFSDFNLQLPFITMAILAVSHVVVKYYLPVLVLLSGGALVLRSWIATAPGGLMWNRIQFGIPVLGGFLRNMQLERLLTTMATLMRSGVSILRLLALLEASFKKNLVFKNALKQATEEIAAGAAISKAFKKTGAFPSLVTEMIRMGEESGSLSDSMAVLSRSYQDQIDQFLRRFSAMIDPVLILGIGGVITVIVMSIFIPIFQLSQIGAN